MDEIITKQCNRCKEHLGLENFHSNKSRPDGLAKRCRKCSKEDYNKRRESILKNKKEYHIKNRKRILKYRKEYYENNKEKVLESAKEYHQNNREKRRIYNKKYNQENKEKINKNKRKYYKKRRKTDIFFKLNHNLSSSIYQSLRQNKKGKHWENIVGYTVDELKNHLESLWEPWMSWDNYGKYDPDGPRVWQIDHIIPKSWFNYTSYEDEEFKKCWSLKNLQPKEGRANNSKGNNYIG